MSALAPANAYGTWRVFKVFSKMFSALHSTIPWIDIAVIMFMVEKNWCREIRWGAQLARGGARAQTGLIHLPLCSEAETILFCKGPSILLFVLCCNPASLVLFLFFFLQCKLRSVLIYEKLEINRAAILRVKSKGHSWSVLKHETLPDAQITYCPLHFLWQG